MCGSKVGILYLGFDNISQTCCSGNMIGHNVDAFHALWMTVWA